MIGTAIARLLERRDLSVAESHGALSEIMEGRATDAQIGAFLAALRMKGETVDEIVGAARAMRERVVPVQVASTPLLDTCGTGGDGAGTFNISTTVAFVAAAAGARVAKHGNRSISSRCGSADVLEALGVRVDLRPEQIAAAIEEVGIGFIFAPAHHPAMKHAMGPRRELGVRTIFNLLGPLTNPAGATRQIMGVFDADLVEPLARVLRDLGAERALVVSGAGGLDEAGLSGANRVALVEQGALRSIEIGAAELGLDEAPPEALRGGDAERNATILRAVLSGEPGAAREVVLLNGGLALVAAGLVDDAAEGVRGAARAIDSGEALAVLERYVEYCGRAA